MQAYDFIVVALLIFAAIWGTRRGFAKQLASLLSIVLGYIVAVNFREPVSTHIDAPHPWNHFAAMLGLFMVTSLMVWIGFRFVNGTIERAGLGAFDSQMGGLFGLVKGVLIVMAITMFAVVLLGDGQREFVLGSYSGNKICRVIQRAHQLVPTEWQQVMEPYLQQVEEHTQLADQPAADSVDRAIDEALFSDPFATDSPSDSNFAGHGSAYEDPNFGASIETVPASVPDAQWPPAASPQARLRQPIFDR